MHSDKLKILVERALKREKDLLSEVQSFREDLLSLEIKIKERTDNLLLDIEALAAGFQEMMNASTLEAEAKDAWDNEGFKKARSEMSSVVIESKPHLSENMDLLSEVKKRRLLAASFRAALKTDKPFMNPKKAVTAEHVTCLVCGRQMTMLKRHLGEMHGITPEVYREVYNLPADYPVTAANYTKLKSKRAQQTGLGKNEPMKSLEQLKREGALGEDE